MPTVLLSAAAAPEDLRESLAGAGFAVLEHALGSTPPVDFASVAVALVEVGERPDAAALQTRRWRAELGDEFVPVVWVLPRADAELAARGLDAGADAILARPLDPAVLVAQVKSGARVRALASRVAARAGEARLLGDHLQKAHARIDRELAAVRRVQRAFLPRSLPAVGSARFAVSHRARNPTGGDFYDVRQLDADRVGFFLTDVIGSGTAAGLLGVFAAQSAAVRTAAPPGEALEEVNRELIALALDDRPLVAMLAGVLNARTGELALARAGVPAPVYIPATGKPEVWTVPGPFLGTADTTYPTRAAVLRPGDKLVIGTDGIRPDGEPNPARDDRLLEVASRHRERSGELFAGAVARDLLAAVRHEDDFTLLVVEMV
jgi:serine phosphatase RsbU (regulator of sigma subunit)